MIKQDILFQFLCDYYSFLCFQRATEVMFVFVSFSMTNFHFLGHFYEKNVHNSVFLDFVKQYSITIFSKKKK